MTDKNNTVELPSEQEIKDFVQTAAAQGKASNLSGEELRKFRSRLVRDFFKVHERYRNLLSTHLVEIYNKSGNKITVKNMRHIAELLKNIPDAKETAVETAKLFQVSEFSGEMRVNRQHYDRNANGAMLYQVLLLLSQHFDSKMDYPAIQDTMNFLEDGSKEAFDFGAAVSVRYGGDMVLHLDQKCMDYLNGLLPEHAEA